MHLLRAGVDVNTIRGWLGHVAEYYQHLRGDRLGDEGEGTGQMRSKRRTSTSQALEGPAFFNGVSSNIVGVPKLNVMWVLTRDDCVDQQLTSSAST